MTQTQRIEPSTDPTPPAPRLYILDDMLRLTGSPGAPTPRSTFYHWLKLGRVPASAEGWPGRSPRWNADIVDAWLANMQ